MQQKLNQILYVLTVQKQGTAYCIDRNLKSNLCCSMSFTVSSEYTVDQGLEKRSSSASQMFHKCTHKARCSLILVHFLILFPLCLFQTAIKADHFEDNLQIFQGPESKQQKIKTPPPPILIPPHSSPSLPPPSPPQKK